MVVVTKKMISSCLIAATVFFIGTSTIILLVSEFTENEFARFIQNIFRQLHNKTLNIQ